MVILSGWTQISVRSSSGKRVIAERGPGQLIGELALSRQNVQSTTVNALTDVTALVMPTKDFASFVSAHPRVLDVVENQIYERLAEDPEVYASDVPQSRGPLSVRRQERPLTGQNCTVILTDTVGFGARSRTDRHRILIRRAALEIMQAAFGPLWEACLPEDRGDGLLVVVPPSIPTEKILERIHRELPGRLRTHNSTYSGPAQIQLRVAVNVGPVTTDDLGLSGDAIVRTARLVEAPVLKAAMEEASQGLGIILSEFVYEAAHAPAERVTADAQYQRVEVSVKEFKGQAWMRLYQLSPQVRGE
jgi:hypothetical protein